MPVVLPAAASNRLLQRNPSAAHPYSWMDNNCQHFAMNLYVACLALLQTTLSSIVVSIVSQELCPADGC